MSFIDRLIDALAGTTHPRLLVLVLFGSTVGVVGTGLAVTGFDQSSGLGTLGFRLSVMGYLVFLLGASGYLAFTIFERGSY